MLRHIVKTLRIYSPDLRREAAANIALVILLNIKAASTHQGLSPSALSEFRNMVRLYIESRLQQPISAKKSAAS